MKSTTRFVTAVAAGVLVSSATFASPAPADGVAVETTYKVQFVRSDLDSAVGAKAAYARLRSAARHVCDSGEPFRDALMFATAIEEEKCTNQALDEAVKRLDNPAVTELHQARND